MKALQISISVLVFAFFSSSALAQVQVYVAASLTELVAQMAQEFEASTDIEITVVTGGSSTLAQQIAAGASADVFISANEGWVNFVQEKRGFEPSVALFGNSLIVVSRTGSGLELTDLSLLPEALRGGRLALGDPAHVPAGIYARQALEGAHVWEDVSDRLAPTSNVRAAVQLVRSGAAPFGIVYASDGLHSDIELVLQIEENLHQDIIYWGALGLEAEQEGKDFFAFLQGPRMKQVALDFGFRVLEGR